MQMLSLIVISSLVVESHSQLENNKTDGGNQAPGAENAGVGEAQPPTSASPLIPLWFPKAPPLPPPQGEVIRAATVDEFLVAVDRVRPGATIALAENLTLPDSRSMNLL